MSIPSELKVAIEEKNWQMVCDIYEDLTGQTIEPISKQSSKNKKTSKKRSKKKKVANKKSKKTISKKDKVVLSQTNKVGVNGRRSVLLTDNIPSKEYETLEEEKTANIEKSKKRTRTIRENKRHTVKCNECQENFQSFIAENTIGQKCPSCLKGRIPSR